MVFKDYNMACLGKGLEFRNWDLGFGMFDIPPPSLQPRSDATMGSILFPSNDCLLRRCSTDTCPHDHI